MQKCLRLRRPIHITRYKTDGGVTSFAGDKSVIKSRRRTTALSMSENTNSPNGEGGEKSVFCASKRTNEKEGRKTCLGEMRGGEASSCQDLSHVGRLRTFRKLGGGTHDATVFLRKASKLGRPDEHITNAVLKVSVFHNVPFIKGLQGIFEFVFSLWHL